jgi:hypothetical protein
LLPNQVDKWHLILAKVPGVWILLGLARTFGAGSTRY